MKILAAVDNDAAARPVLEVAAAVAEVLGDVAEGLHVGSPEVRTARSAAVSVRVPLRTVAGDPVTEILTALAAPDVRVGVVGIRHDIGSTRPAGHILLGVAGSTDKPIMAVPPNVRVDAWAGRPRILVPLDGTAATSSALERGVPVFAGAGADVVALHVFNAATVPRFWDRPSYEPALWAEEFLARYCAQAGTELRLRSGSPGEQVLDVAKSERADLVVLAWAQDLTGLRAQVIRQLLAETRVPLLLLPAEAGADEGGDRPEVWHAGRGG